MGISCQINNTLGFWAKKGQCNVGKQGKYKRQYEKWKKLELKSKFTHFGGRTETQYSRFEWRSRNLNYSWTEGSIVMIQIKRICHSYMNCIIRNESFDGSIIRLGPFDNQWCFFSLAELQLCWRSRYFDISEVNAVGF